jgi:hypothetical protein
MGLKDLIDDTKEKLEEAIKLEDGIATEEPEKEEEAPEAVEEPEPKEEKVEEKPEEPKDDEELDASGYRKLRRDLKAAQKQIEDLKAAKTKDAEPVAEREETPEAVLPPEVVDLVEERKYQKAGQEFSSMEEDFKKNAPDDFEDVSLQYKASLYQHIRIDNPRMTHDQLLAETNKKLLMKASKYLNEGYNPIEEMYEDAKSLGFKKIPKDDAPAATEEVEVKKPDLSKVAANRARNAGMAAAKGRAGQPALTQQSAATMSVAEWSKLPTAEKRRLLAGG